MTLLHGDDSVRIHARALALVSSAQKDGAVLERVEAKGLSIATLESIVGTEQLFSSKKVIWIDRLHSLPKSTLKDGLITWIVAWAEANPDTECHIILTEEKVLPPAQLKKIPVSTIEIFKLPQILFSFIESIGVVAPTRAVTLFHEVLQNQEVELVFAMIVRQIRMLLLFVSGGIYVGPPFGRTKIITQSKNFTQAQLLDIHRRLLAIDLGQKTSSSPHTLIQEIDLLLLED